MFRQSVSTAEVRDRGYGEEARKGHHAGNRGRRKRCGHDSDRSRWRGDQWQRGHAGHQLFGLLHSAGGAQTWRGDMRNTRFVRIFQIC